MFELVLGKVADGQPLAFGALSREWRHFGGQQFDQRRLAGAVSAKQRNALAGAQGQLDAVENDLGASGGFVATAGVVQHQQGIGCGCGVAETKGERRIDVRCRHFLHALQRLHAALCLPGLGRLGTEAVDEAVQVLDLALLLFVHRLLQCQLGRTLSFEGGVVAGVELHAALLDMQDVADHGVEEVAVVRDHHQRAAITAQPAFEPEHGVKVEVVGRFVEQQEVGAAHQRPRQVQPHSPATGELGHRPAEVGVGEAQPVQQFRGAGLGRVTINFGEAGVQGADVRAIMRRFGFGQRTFHLLQFAVAVEHKLQRWVGQGRGFLSDVGDDPGRWKFEVAAFGMQRAGEQCEKRGFAAAVAAGQAHLPARSKLQGGIFDQGFGGAGKRQVTENDHGGEFRTVAGKGCASG